jgi:cadherin domain-containing protein
VGAAFNPANGHYFISDDNAKRVYDVDPGADGLGTANDTWTFFSTVAAGNGDPEGVAYNASNGRLYVADGVNREVYEYTTSGTLLSHFDTAQYAVQDPETVEVNSVTGTLFVLSNRQSNPAKIIETTTGGSLLQTIDVSAAAAFKPAGVAYANASDGSGVKRFYIVDRGVDNNNDPNAVDGKLYEMTTPGGPPGNNPPVITSDGGGATAANSVPENQTAVTDVDATDPDGDPLTYSISGGADAARFTINASSGVLTFVSPPDFENPTDVGANNVYNVVIRASDGTLFDEQAIAVTVTDVVEGGGSPLYFSLLDPATVGGVAAENEDVVFFNGTAFSLAFDGSDVGITSFRIDAFSWVDATRLLLSFDTAGSVPGIAGTTDDSDIVLFTSTSLGPVTAGTFSMYFHAADVGLTTSGEGVDAVELLPNGRILISTVGTATVTGLTADDEDLMRFNPTQLGPVTAGKFFLYFNGTDVDLTASGEDVDAAAVGAGGAGKIYLSTLSNFSVTGISGQEEDIFVLLPPRSDHPLRVRTRQPLLRRVGLRAQRERRVRDRPAVANSASTLEMAAAKCYDMAAFDDKGRSCTRSAPHSGSRLPRPYCWAPRPACRTQQAASPVQQLRKA